MPARRGDVVIFNLCTVHGSYINQTNAPRRLVRASCVLLILLSLEDGVGLNYGAVSHVFRSVYVIAILRTSKSQVSRWGVLATLFLAGGPRAQGLQHQAESNYTPHRTHGKIHAQEIWDDEVCKTVIIYTTNLRFQIRPSEYLHACNPSIDCREEMRIDARTLSARDPVAAYALKTSFKAHCRC